MRFIVRLLVNAAALAIATWILSGISLTGSSTTSKVITLLIVALIFGVLNAIIKPLFALFTAPLILLTLGLFLIVINACMGVSAEVGDELAVPGQVATQGVGNDQRCSVVCRHAARCGGGETLEV